MAEGMPSRAVARELDLVDRLLEAAETLFGKFGLDGVSMRQIQLAAGSNNKFVVQYHFGGAEGLIEAILAARVPTVDRRQYALLDRLDADQRSSDVRALLDAFLRPLLEQKNSTGERTYARFISALLRSPDGERYCAKLFHLTPTTGRILALLKSALSSVPSDLLGERLRLLTGMVCTSVFNRIAAASEARLDEQLITDALDVATAGLAASP